MADAVFTARAATPDLVKESIKKLSLPKNSNNQYNHNAATYFKTACLQVLKSTYNLVAACLDLPPKRASSPK